MQARLLSYTVSILGSCLHELIGQSAVCLATTLEDVLVRHTCTATALTFLLKTLGDDRSGLSDE
jgi:hypothetical protein